MLRMTMEFWFENQMPFTIFNLMAGMNALAFL